MGCLGGRCLDCGSHGTNCDATYRKARLTSHIFAGEASVRQLLDIKSDHEQIDRKIFSVCGGRLQKDDTVDRHCFQLALFT